jgi:hypothetical protein
MPLFPAQVQLMRQISKPAGVTPSVTTVTSPRTRYCNTYSATIWIRTFGRVACDKDWLSHIKFCKDGCSSRPLNYHGKRT